MRHRDREVQLDLRCPEPSEVAFAAFYADCVHEILPIHSGCRLTLVYNLLRPGKGRLPGAAQPCGRTGGCGGAVAPMGRQQGTA
ncbi:MAG: hypothetical protein IPP10_16365 [Candidatus Competibacteraceae bacterium]|nr:hypothetical protein [Candidatus Competibacteraceae bacterium]